ncbi:MAG TPA: Gfo/Idh/MocA family oxidoreductase [Vicinamibacterales bacterium]
MIRVGVVGYGYWGPNIVRNFAETPGCQVVGVADMRADRLALVRARYPAVRTFADPNELVGDRRVDAVVIVTPVSTHYDLALQALRSGKHVLVEKPLAATSEQALRLVDEADRRSLVLSVDHTFVYTGAVRKIRELITADRTDGVGDIYYYDSVRVNLGLFQHDVNVMWDLAVHDLAIMDYVLPSRPVAVSATGMSHLSGRQENIAYLTLFFEERLMAHLHVNWLAPVKVRRTLIGGSRKMIVYDDLEPSEKIKVYDKGVNVNGGNDRYRMRVDYRSGDMCAPQIDIAEALGTEARHFIACVDSKRPTVTDGHAGLRVVRVLEAATQSIAARGRVVEFDSQRCAV